jgi:hypothetical protein
VKNVTPNALNVKVIRFVIDALINSSIKTEHAYPNVLQVPLSEMEFVSLVLTANAVHVIALI